MAYAVFPRKPLGINSLLLLSPVCLRTTNEADAQWIQSAANGDCLLGAHRGETTSTWNFPPESHRNAKWNHQDPIATREQHHKTSIHPRCRPSQPSTLERRSKRRRPSRRSTPGMYRHARRPSAASNRQDTQFNFQRCITCARTFLAAHPPRQLVRSGSYGHRLRTVLDP